MRQVARCQESYHGGGAIYRHSVTDGTKFARPGDILPFGKENLGCNEGSWEALAQDNLNKSGSILTFVELIGAASGPVVEFDAGFIAEVAMTVNLRGAVGNPDMKKGGLYRISRVDMATRKGDEAPHICINKTGDIDPRKFIYELRLA